MSLQVWLPLNGDLHNQGIKKYNISTLGTISWPTTGKIGKCFQGGAGTQVKNGLSLDSNLTDILNADYSIAVWVKPLGSHVHYNGTIISSGDWNKKRWAFGVNQDNTKVDVLSNGHNVYLNCSVPVNTWTHLVCIRQNGVIKLYKNGIYIDSLSTSTASANLESDATNTTIGRQTYANGYFSFNGCINDLRIYNNALAEKQIKQISKGLILHYPLNDVYIESTENLITTEDCLSSTYYNGAISKYSYGTSTDTYKIVGTFQGKKCTKVYNKTNTTQMQPYVYINNMFTSDGTNKPQYKTLSFDYYTTISTSLVPYKLGSGNGTATYKVKNTEIKTGSGVNQVTIPVKPNMWNHIQIVFHGTTEANSEWGYIRNLPTHTSNTSNYWLFANMQLEEKDHATGYAGIGGIRDTLFTYDISGYQNNGTKHNITYDSDTPKYEVSSVFTSTNTGYIKVSENNWASQGAEEMTINLWVNPNASFSKFFSCTESGGWNTESGSSGYLRFPVHVYTNQGKTSTAYKYDSKQLKISDIPLNEWTMITFVYDGTGTRTYINGQLHHTCLFTSYGIHYNINNARLFLGCEASAASPSSPYLNGKMSDFRIYATALSAEEILSLYNNEAEIDQSGIIHGQIR